MTTTPQVELWKKPTPAATTNSTPAQQATQTNSNPLALTSSETAGYGSTTPVSLYDFDTVTAEEEQKRNQGYSAKDWAFELQKADNDLFDR